MAQRELYPELPSTQDRALQLARQGAPDGSVVVARRQTRGRGRGTRRWESPDGGLYLSVVLAPSSPGPLFPLAVGAAIADALSLEYRVRLRLKWPNDLLAIDGGGTSRKLGGLLVDVVPRADGSSAAVVGIGVNARTPASRHSPAVRASSVGLEELAGAPVDLDRLESVVVQAAKGARSSLEESGGDRPVLARVRGLLYGVGEAVAVDGAGIGTLVGVRPDGALEVLGPDGPRIVLAGHLSLGAGR